MSLTPAWKARSDKYKLCPCPFQIWHTCFFSLSQLPLYWKQASLFIFLSSLDQAFLEWFMSFADHFLQTGLLSCHAFMQVSHTSCVSVRAWPKELLLLLLLFKGVSDSCGMLLTWILTASLCLQGSKMCGYLTALKSHLFCSSSFAGTWHVCHSGCLKDPATGCPLGGGFSDCLH